jgi:hypothetical protein
MLAVQGGFMLAVREDLCEGIYNSCAGGFYIAVR